MKPKIYELLLRCIEEGTQTGYYRAFKHDDTPCEALVTEKIVDAIMGELFEAFDIDAAGPFDPKRDIVF
jgi:hypothetical protein